MKETALLYIGAFSPDSDARNEATSRAAQIFQRDFLSSLADGGSARPEVLTYAPVPSYPKGPLLCAPRRFYLAEGWGAKTLAHINLGALKVLALGASAAWETVKWVRRNHGRRLAVVTYNLNAPPAFLLAPVCRLVGAELVPFVGDVYVPGEVVADSLLRRWEFALQKRAISRADRLIVCNTAIVEDFAPGRDFIVIEGGVPRSLVDQFSMRRAKGGDGLHVVFAGQLTELNGVRLLLEAFALDPDPGWRATVMGGGPLAEEVLAAASADPRIDYRGLVPHEEVLRTYGEADVLLNLRSTEYRTHRYVFPSKVVECLATGVPLVSTVTGHVEKEFGEFVLLLEQETPRALADMLRFVAGLAPSARHDLGRRAQEYVRRHKTWEAQTSLLREYLDEERAA